MSDETFEQADSGASLTTPLQCSALRKGGHIVIKGHPCKVVEISTSKTGKHGHAKAHIVALDIFTQKKYEELSPSTHNIEVPTVKRSELLLIDIDEDDYLSLMDDNGETRADLKVPGGELGEKLRARFENDEETVCTVLAAMGHEAVIEFKNSK